MTRSHRPTLIVTLLLVMTAFFLRTSSLDFQPLWRDEVDALRFATVPWAELLESFTRPGWNGPLYFSLLRVWILLVGDTGFAMRFLSVIFGVLAVPLIYLLGGRLFNGSVGLLAALLTATSPYFVWYGQEVKMYTLVPVLAMAAIYALRRAVRRHGVRWWCLATTATSLAVYVHIMAALLIPVEVALCLVWWRDARRQWRAALVSLTVLLVPYLPLLAWQIPAAFQTRETGFYPYALGEMGRILLTGWVLGIQARGSPWGMAVPLVAASVGVLGSAWAAVVEPARLAHRGRLSFRKAAQGVVATLAWIVLPLSGIALLSIRQPMFTDRYLIWVAPALYLLIGCGLTFIARLGRVGPVLAAASMGAILVFNGMNICWQARNPIKADFRGATSYLLEYAGLRRPPPARDIDDTGYPYRMYLPMVTASETASPIEGLVLFQIPYGRYSFDYYAQGHTYAWAGGLYTNYRRPDGTYSVTAEQVDQRMWEILDGYPVVWLVATEAAMWDDRELIQAWLDTHLQRVDAAHFTRVDVYRYVRRAGP